MGHRDHLQNVEKERLMLSFDIVAAMIGALFVVHVAININHVPTVRELGFECFLLILSIFLYALAALWFPVLGLSGLLLYRIWITHKAWNRSR